MVTDFHPSENITRDIMHYYHIHAAPLLTPDVSIPLKNQSLLPTVIQHAVAGLLYYP